MANMAIDLYKDDLSQLGDAEVRRAIEEFTRISEPAGVRPRESFVLDFKQEWNEGALQTVAAFAHTFGGLLIVGVAENSGMPEALVGVEAHGELKTSIASSIATNISPVPQYNVADCSLAQEPDKKLAVVRVRPGNSLYYYTKKDSKYPIYVRNNDESVPANAAQLRSLIERKTSVLQSHTEMQNRFNALRPSVQLRKTADILRGQIPTHLQIIAAPLDHPALIIDSEVEQQFRKRIHRNFSFRDRDGNAEKQEDRYLDWYELRWFRPAEANESVWRLTSAGDVVYATQARVRVPDGENLAWSLGDTVADLLLLLAVARSMWKMFGFYGEAQVLVTLVVHDLVLRTDLVSEIWPRSNSNIWFLMQDFNAALKDSIISLNSQPAPTSTATGFFNAGLPSDANTETVASIMNQLLRCLKHSADLNSLKRAVHILLRVGQE